LSDVGGDFTNVKRYVEGSIATKSTSASQEIVHQGPGGVNVDQYRSYTGPIAAIGPDAASGQWPWPPSAQSTDSALNALGTTAIAQCKPDNAIASAGSALGEIFTGGLPHLAGSTFWRSKVDTARKAGDEYLNAQFGWLPLVSDIGDFAKAVRNFDAVLKQYERDAGRQVRRRYEFPTETTEEEVVIPNAPGWVIGSGGNVQQSYGTRVIHKSVVKKRWFSGAFTYHLPSGYDSRNELDRLRLFANRIGLNVSPNTLWELAPWSWAVDWFSNAGDVISNVQSFELDGSVMVYGYMMEHTVSSHTYTNQGGRDINNRPFDFQPVTLVTETKVRRGANPYGFGITWEALSPFQVSILTALGLTKGRR